jgi:hypothetical protein
MPRGSAQTLLLQIYFQITCILLHSCPDLLLHLDYLVVNPTQIQMMVKNIQTIRIESVTFDTKYQGRQRLRMAFSNLGSATISSLSIREAVEVHYVVSYKLFIFRWGYPTSIGRFCRRCRPPSSVVVEASLCEASF